MTPNEYQQAALTTLATDNERDTLMMCALGISGEVGEVNDILKKHLYHSSGKPLDRDKISGEMGDCLWYAVVMATTLDIAIGDIMPVLNFGTGSSLTLIGLGLAEEAGTIACLVKMFYMDSQFSRATKRDVVDSIQYHLHSLVTDIAILAGHIGTTINGIMTRNIAKLAARHKADGAEKGFNPIYQSDSVPAPNFPVDLIAEKVIFCDKTEMTDVRLEDYTMHHDNSITARLERQGDDYAYKAKIYTYKSWDGVWYEEPTQLI